MKKIEDTRNIAHRTMTPQLPSKEAPWDLTPFSQSPSAAPLYFPESHQWSEISSLSKVILVLGKARHRRASNLGCREPESCVWFDISPKNSAWDVMYAQAHCHDEAANHQLPIAAAFWIIWIVSVEECSRLTQSLMQIHCSAHSIILNATTTQYTCSLNGVYHPHWLVQWSRHCPRTCIPVCSPWLPGYIDATQSVLVILILGVLFLDRTHQHVFLVVKLTLFISLMWCLPIFSIVKWLFLPL